MTGLRLLRREDAADVILWHWRCLGCDADVVVAAPVGHPDAGPPAHACVTEAAA